ncbi:HNH endonuclease signature motif containing protein [Sinirhodobacter sp. HNIBRBA609]|nr:HNH endonuclease signature motif containing protein [Sinirhodobacter sp. HNIBRBA609]
MLNIARPNFDSLDVFEKCARGQSPRLEALLQGVSPLISQEFSDYKDAMGAEGVVEFPRSNAILGFSKDDFLSLYNEQFVKKSGACRLEYERLLASSPRKKCPMCSESTVTALDHHLPKSSYFRHAVNPDNLVPICSRCNEAKKHTMPNAESKQFMHPYFDDFSKAPWLEFVFLERDPIEVEFRSIRPAGVSDRAFEKIKSHFTRLKLNELYTSNAIVMLEDLKETFSIYFDLLDWESVREELSDNLRRCQRRPDSWEYAMFSVLSECDWYIQGGFSRI